MNTTKLGRRLGGGKEAEVFECGERVLKLYRAGAPKSSAFREAAYLAIVEALGLPAPAALGVELIGERWGVAMSLAPGESFADAIVRQPARAPEYLEAMARLHVRIHSHPGTRLGSMKARLRTNIREQATMLGEPRQLLLQDGLAQLPDGDSLCHGDFHPWNILGPSASAVVVDWLDACEGSAAADVCRSYVLMKHAAADLASAYVETYAAAGGSARADIFAWLPFVAAARLAEGVPHEVDGLMEMVEAV
jgi:Ser/Thr protein kinase RdoA (MazF antagonist)